MRRKRIVQAGKCYHLVSRVAHKAFFFDDEEKDRFVDLLMRVEFFCCVRVLAYCCMSNHIHVFIFLEEGREMSEDEILAIITAKEAALRLASDFDIQYDPQALSIPVRRSHELSEAEIFQHREAFVYSELVSYRNLLV